MKLFPQSITDKLLARTQALALRELKSDKAKVDFSSNDYLGFASSKTIFDATHELLLQSGHTTNGATGSRLLSGNHPLYADAETVIAAFHNTESALLFNSGYDANLGFFSAVPQRGDVVLYDELCHASIRDGIRLGTAKSFRFQHNDIEDCERLINKYRSECNNIYIGTESVFSMDGDTPNLEQLASLCEKHNCFLVVDEAHALGVFGANGEGLAQHLNLENRIFARIVTFGKGLGCHGAAVLGAPQLRNYLINFARSFIYTTALPPHSLSNIITAYTALASNTEIDKLRDNILHFSQEKRRCGLTPVFTKSKSAIQSAIIPGNEKVKSIAAKLSAKGFDVKPILSPTVPEGQERLRYCLHCYNTADEITSAIETLRDNLFQ